ncbi:Ig-like domain-containing protein [Pseudomonas sp. LD120]|uniref:Ig-like domain-containing protein n=1 Tax=Pseudomonas sp. LD120 TaxID=485751 RepID=UPI00135CC386|nr:Ig-like domain-containing protein [Pseudomonas sp. LD120]KAF0864780.1 DUF4347 domain-containing protein [Pseudomonas sp. LD120]
MWWSKQKSRAEGVKTLVSPMIIPLEPRMLFDGAVAATVAEAAQPADHPSADAAKAPATEHGAAPVEAHPQSDAAPTPAPAAVPGQSVVFVDARVKDFDSLLKGAAPGTEVVVLQAGKDGLQQIADYLDTHQGVSTVEIVAHGNSGDLWLGSTYLSADNVASRADVLARIGNDMNVGGDILIYACNTAAGDKGISFVDSLAQYTGRDIAASTNRTGLGGDWTLEIATGSIESRNVLSADAMAGYQYGLATLTVLNTNDAGADSLRQMLSDALAGDTVTFSSAGMTVNLESQLIITKNLTVDGDLNNDGLADVTISGQYKTQVLKVNSGVTATLDGLIITKGLAAGRGGDAGVDASAAMGGGIVNAGNLTLINVTVTANAASGGGGGGGVSGAYVGGGGGGGGGIGGQAGGRGGNAGSGTGNYAGKIGTPNQGGNGGGYDPSVMGGKGGNSNGGNGGIGGSGYSNGGSGGGADNGVLAIGGGGGGSGWDSVGRAGASATGGIYNASTGTLTVVGTSVISNNIAAGGGGGGGGGGGSGASNDPGGVGGKGVGAIWNKGTLLMTAANFAAMSNNTGASGFGGQSASGGTGNSPAAVSNIFNDGGNINTSYAPAPTATIVVADSALKIGETSQVTITFSEAVTGFSNADLTIANGTLSAVSSSDGGVTWTATLTPTSNITDSTNVITLDNTGVQNGTGTAGTGVTNSNNYVIDTQRPTATVWVADSALNVGETSQVTITFSEAVTGFSNADLTIANGTLSAVSSSDGGVTWTATLTPTSNITDSANVITLDNSGVADQAGNAGSGSTDSNNYAIDTQRPTATIVVADNSLTAGETSQVTITFSEAVTGFSNADLTIANGTLSAVSSSDGGVTWTATLTPSNNVTDATNLITLTNSGVFDLAGNAGSGSTDSNNYAVDTLLPSATIVVADTSLSINETSLVTITFNQAVTGFSLADLSVANGTLANLSSSDGGVTWTATLTPSSNITDMTNQITLDNSGVQSLSGNVGTGTSGSNNYMIDGERPTATVVVADSTLKAGQSSTVTVTFSEAVTGLTLADLTVANGSLSNLSSVDGGITWTATLTPSANLTDTTNLITLDNTGYTDWAGNAGSGTTDSNNYAIDTQRPTATIVVANPNLTVGDTSLVTITFSEAVTGFSNADLSVPNGTLSAVSSSDGGITWTATFTPALGVSDATNLITLNNTTYTDLAGNTGTGSTDSGNFTIDTQVPTATIVVADSALNIGETSLVTITFSEAVGGFSNADLTVANGTLSSLSTSDGGITWTATFTPNSNVTDTTNLITLDNTGVQGLSSGNSGVGTTDSNNYAIDTQRPTATVVVANDHLGVGGTSLVTITFSEAVTGFTLADLSAESGTLSGLSTSDNITYTATLTSAAGVTQANNHILLDNSGVIDGAGNNGSATTSSNAYAVDSQRPTATIVVANPNLTVGDTSLVTITFSEAVTGFSNADLSVPNGTLSAVSSSDGGITWTATFTPALGVSDATNLITLNNTTYTDLAGNTGTGSTDSGNFTIDTQVPTATIVVADSALNVGETSLVTITFSEAVGGFSNADLTVANGTLSSLSTSDGGITWTATFTPNSNVTDTTNLITLDNTGVQGLSSGNSGVGTTDSNNYAIDTQRPTATISVANDHLGIGQTTTVTITFNEVVSGFDLSDLSVANGTLSNLASSDGGKTWTATLTPTAAVTDPTNLIVLDMGLVSDGANNAGSGIAISNNYSVDADLPTATIVVANPNLTAGQTTTVTFTFSEKVIGFDLSDLSVANGVLSNLITSDGGKTWTATLTPTANITDPSNFITLDTSLVSDLSGNAGSGFANSNNYGITTVALGGDPQFRITDPTPPADLPNLPLQPIVFGQPTGNLGVSIGFPPLFEARDSGGGLPPLGNIFIGNGGLAPSYIAQVFNTEGGGDGNSSGFLGFGGGDGGVFGSSTLAELFNRESTNETSALNAFDRQGTKSLGDASQGLRGAFGAPTLGQQLQQIKDTEQNQLRELAWAFEQVGISEVSA